MQAFLARTAGRPVEILTASPLSGGCISSAVRLSTDLGEDFFLKWNSAAGEEFFAAEADGVRALHGVGALRVPRVIGHSPPGQIPAWLLLEFVHPGRRAPDYAERLGQGLAELHSASGKLYGWERSNYIGSLPQSNRIMDDWATFWWTERLEPQLELARSGGRLPGRTNEWHRLESRLSQLLGPTSEDAPSVLHGDLWSGNVYAGPAGEPVLVDPAVYRGHREVDLAMTELFRGFPSGFYSAYEEASPLIDGYAEVRRAVYQLYPLLVHVNLFGGSYVESTARMLERTLRGA